MKKNLFLALGLFVFLILFKYLSMRLIRTAVAKGWMSDNFLDNPKTSQISNIPKVDNPEEIAKAIFLLQKNDPTSDDIKKLKEALHQMGYSYVSDGTQGSAVPMPSIQKRMIFT